MKRVLLSLVALLAFATVVSPRSARAQVEPISGHFTTSDGVDLHYLEAGSGSLLVFIPGWTMPAWIWKPQLEHFARSHRVAALDPRGQGESEKPTHGYDPWRRGRDVCELLEHLGEPAVVAGWSLGVQEILICAHQVGTEAIRAAVLVDFEIVWENTDELTPWLISLQTDREKWTRTFVESMYNSRQSEEYFDALTQAALSTPTNAAAMMISNLILISPTDLRPAVDALDRPVLFVYSSHDWAVAAADQVRRAWPDAPVEIIDDSYHALFVDQPDDFNRVLEAFMAKLPDN